MIVKLITILQYFIITSSYGYALYLQYADKDLLGALVFYGVGTLVRSQTEEKDLHTKTALVVCGMILLCSGLVGTKLSQLILALPQG